ncbi:aminotransferase class III-fold pyridoxal phosphate-dependent enzyme [Mycolicibacterium litorale]|uniref:aminotransferase class III-fold pyridoxal phosphate-dependent enzyme n=1 Tax=Mycolicibacterium litorale TaxID=758802 RepID=UPI003CE927C3
MFAIAPRTPMAVRGCGCYLRDDAGRRVIDLNNNFTSQIHGNAHPEVVEATQKAVAEGTSFGDTVEIGINDLGGLTAAFAAHENKTRRRHHRHAAEPRRADRCHRDLLAGGAGPVCPQRHGPRLR